MIIKPIYKETFNLVPSPQSPAIHQWRHTANEFNRRLDITELRTFTNLSPQEIRSLYEALQESKEFNDALNLTQHITIFLKSKYPKGGGDSEVVIPSRNY